MRRLFFTLVLLCGCSQAQTYYTDCAGVAGTSLSGIVACPSLPAGYTIAFNPKAVVDWTYPTQPKAKQITVSTSGANATRGTALQNAINTAASNCGSTGFVINVPAGFTYTAQNVSPQSFIIPHNNCTAGHYVVIQNASLFSLSRQGTRVKRTDISNMPRITNNLTGGSHGPIFYIGDAPDAVPAHWWFSGLEIVNGSPAGGASPVEVAYFYIGDNCAARGPGCSSLGITGQSSLSNDIHLDRLYMHSNTCTGASTDDALRFGVSGDGWNVSMSDSIEDCVVDTSAKNSQSLAWAFDQTFGTHALVNNELRGATEMIGFGFSTPPVTGTVPSDIYIYGNYIHTWTTTYWQKHNNQRSWIECESCQRILIEGNHFDTNRATSQRAAFMLTPRNSSGSNGVGGCTWCVVQDVTIRYNFMKDMSNWVQILGANGTASGGSSGPERPAKRITIHDNVAENLDENVYGEGRSPASGRWIVLEPGDASSTGCSAAPFSDACKLSDIIITHNTLTGTESNTEAFWTIAGTPPSGGMGYNIVITNNIAPAGRYGFTSDTGTAHPLTGFLESKFSSYKFDNNVITGILGAGYRASDFPSPICNFNDTATGCSRSNPGWAAAMSNVGFVNYNAGIGGDYHLCITSSVPSGCSGQSVFEDMATDSFLDNTKEGPSPGANIDAVNQMTACAVTGNCTIQPVRVYGPVKGQVQEMRIWVRFPAYFDVAASDGSGKPDFSGASNPGESWSGMFPFHDLQHDPAGLMNLSGANAGLSDHDYYQLGTSQPCGVGLSISDSKAFWGQVSVIESNNVRVGLLYRGPLIATSTHLPADGTQIMWNYKWYIYRPGKIYERHSWDNNCGSLVSFSGANAQFQSTISNSVYTFDAIPGAQQYPPSYGLGWADNVWQKNPCHGRAAVYDSCTGYPWGFIDNSGLTPGVLFHSVTASQGDVATGTKMGITDGYTNPYGNTSLHYPVTAEFAKIEHENASAWKCCAGYRAGAAGGGIRSKLEGSATIPSNGTDSYVSHALLLAGDLGIRDLTKLQSYQVEYNRPPTPRVNAGSGVAFNYDDGSWHATASATPSLDITTTGTMTSPAFLISRWNDKPPTVSVAGVTKTPNVDYVYARTDATHLLIQLVDLPTNGSGGMTTLPRSTRVIITAGALPFGSDASRKSVECK